MSQLGRPKAIDETKRREFCALIAAGCGIRWAARYIGCSPRTVRREAIRNDDFHHQLRRAERAAQLAPLNAIKHASRRHWRTAAWFLERTCPERFSKHEPERIDRDDVVHFFEQLVELIKGAIPDGELRARIFHSLTEFFDSSFRDKQLADKPRRDPRRAKRYLDFLAARQQALDSLNPESPLDPPPEIACGEPVEPPTP